ncbi:MAG TPA: hypothetical protein VEA40_00455 [Ramlibacter sp.]|nr:hypothetical protein [Ramlibacter sp.]
MNRADFQPCCCCGKGVAHTGVPLFWRVRIERMGIERGAVQQQHGLEQFFGGGHGAVALADVFAGGPLARPLQDSATEVLVCETCAVSSGLPLAAMAEEGQRHADTVAHHRRAAAAQQAGHALVQVVAGVAFFALALGWLGPRLDQDAPTYSSFGYTPHLPAGEAHRLEVQARAHCDARSRPNGSYIRLADGGIVCTDKRGRPDRATRLAQEARP